jgi:hypothetical protein
LAEFISFFAVKEEISLTQAKTAEIRDELKSLQGSLAIQNNKVAEQELQLKWLREKEKIMNAQKQHLEETKMKLQDTFVRLLFLLGTGFVLWERLPIFLQLFCVKFQSNVQDERQRER